MPKINKIKLSGATYDIQDSNASKTVTLTQAQYDALQTKDPNTFYIISDGETFDPSEKVDTSAFTAYSASVETALSGKAAQSDLNTLSGTVTGHTSDSTIHVTASDKATWNAKSDFSGSYNDLTNKLSAGTNITIVDNVISAEGGGKAIEAGRGISVTTGETADTVSFNLPISAGTSNNNLIIGESTNISNSNRSIATGFKTKAQQSNAFAQGYKTDAGQEQSHAEGYETKAYGVNSHSEGRGTSAMTVGSHAEGYYTITSNSYEHTQGQYNVSNKANTTFGDSGNTLFSVGNGTSSSARHNAFEVRQNGDIYLSLNGQDVKLQDQLGGGGGITSGEVQSMIDESISGKANSSDATYQVNASTQNNGIYFVTLDKGGSQIDYSSEPQIRFQAPLYSDYDDGKVKISGVTAITSASTDNEIPTAKAVFDALGGGGGSSVVELTQAQYDALTTIDPDTIYVITDAAGGDLSNYYTKAQINAMIGNIESLLAAI